MSKSARGIAVRDATPDDLPTLVDLVMEVQQLHVDGRPDLFREPDRMDLADFMSARLADHCVLVAIIDGDVVGYLLAEHEERDANPFRQAHSTWHVHHIAVNADTRRAGAGRTLIQALTDRARSIGSSSVQLSSWAFNSHAHEFFEAQGFAPMSITFEHRLDRAESGSAQT